jgi:CHAD domain-containing protein
MECLNRLEQIEPKGEADHLLMEDAPARMKQAFRRLRKVGDELDVNSEAAEFHLARIRAKRLRYTVEFFVPIYAKPAERLVKKTTALQDLLGDHQDGVVSAQLIHEAVRASAEAWAPETMMALGRVVQWEAQHGDELRRGFRPTYREVQETWRRLREAR